MFCWILRKIGIHLSARYLFTNAITGCVKCKNVKSNKKVRENWLAPGVRLDFDVWGV